MEKSINFELGVAYEATLADGQYVTFVIEGGDNLDVSVTKNGETSVEKGLSFLNGAANIRRLNE